MTREEFVRTWNAAPSLAEAARRLGRTASSAKSWASELRRLGHPLKKFKSGPKPVATPGGLAEWSWSARKRRKEF